MDKTVAVIFPAYNEERTISDVVTSFYKVMPEAYFFIIDNNSSDNTAEFAQKTLVYLGAKGAVISERAQGKGNAIRRAFLEIQADCYVMVDADMTYPAEHLPALIEPILSGKADMVNGNRHALGDYMRENKRPFHNFGNKLVQNLVQLVSGSRVQDIMSGYKAFSATFVQCYPLLVEGFQLETDLCLFAAQARMRVLEIPINYVDRPDGSFSKLNTFQDGIRVLRCIFSIFRHDSPLLFFSALSFFLGGLSLLCGGTVIYEWIRWTYITRIPLAILAVALGLSAVISLATGFILDAIRFRNNRDVELQIKRCTKPLFVLGLESKATPDEDSSDPH